MHREVLVLGHDHRSRVRGGGANVIIRGPAEAEIEDVLSAVAKRFESARHRRRELGFYEKAQSCAPQDRMIALLGRELQDRGDILGFEVGVIRQDLFARPPAASKSSTSFTRIRRPTVPSDVRALIRTMARANPLWGAPRIHGELLQLGIDVCQATVAKYMVRPRRPASQTWRTFLANHIGQVIAADFFVVPTATCRLLFVLVILAHERRRIVHVAVTEHPTAAWTAQQLREAFPWDCARRYLLRDRDHAFHAWANTATAMEIQEVLTAPRSPWQNAYVERFIGSARRECLDHVVVFNATGLQRLMQLYCTYYEQSRTHLSLNKDAPIPRPIATPVNGRVVANPQVGGLHHRYERQAA